jgi:hypothetical protein
LLPDSEAQAGTPAPPAVLPVTGAVADGLAAEPLTVVTGVSIRSRTVSDAIASASVAGR